MANLPSAISAASFPIQDYVTIDGFDSPGLCTVRGAGTPRNWDKRKGYGASGAWLVFMGNDLSSFEIDIYLWDAKLHPAAWLTWAANCLKKTPKGKPAISHTIDHPLLKWAPLDITKIVITDVSQPEQDDTGGWIITIKVQEFDKPLPVIVKNTDTPDAPSAPPVPKTAAEIHTAQLSAQRDALANGSDKSGLL